MAELRQHDQVSFKNYTRLSPTIFDDLLERLSQHITKLHTKYRQTLPPSLKLAVFLRHMTTGALYIELGYKFRVGKETVRKFIPEIAHAIVQEYSAEVIHCPTTPEEWKEIATQFAYETCFMSWCLGW